VAAWPVASDRMARGKLSVPTLKGRADGHISVADVSIFERTS